MPDICLVSAYVKHKKRPRRSEASLHNREVDSGVSMLANNCSRQGLCASVQKRTAPDPDLCENAGKPDPEPEVVCIFAQPPPEGEGLLGALFTPRPDPRFRWCVLGARSGHLVGV